jgi:crotonobetainyl-CoA:carnitine CoA-transferase CaiB-like acyl-CoA transferase
MALALDEHLATGALPGPGHGLLTGRYACYDVYPARDGRWLAVAAIESVFWANLCRALGLERWIPQQLDDAAQPAIRADLRAAFAARDRDDWVAALAGADTCVAPVLDAAEVARDPHFAARGTFQEATHPEHGVFRQVGAVLAGQLAAPAGPVPAGRADRTDTELLLGAAGYAAPELERLRREGVIE